MRFLFYYSFLLFFTIFHLFKFYLLFIFEHDLFLLGYSKIDKKQKFGALGIVESHSKELWSLSYVTYVDIIFATISFELKSKSRNLVAFIFLSNLPNCVGWVGSRLTWQASTNLIE